MALGGTSTQRHRSSLAVSSPTLPTGVQTSTEGYCCGPALSWTLDRGPRSPCASRAAGRVDLAHGSETLQRLHREPTTGPLHRCWTRGGAEGNNRSSKDAAGKARVQCPPCLSGGTSTRPGTTTGTHARSSVDGLFLTFSLGWHTVTVTARHQALVAHTPLGYIGMYILSAYVCKCVCYEGPRLHRPRRLFNTSHERTDGRTERTDGRTDGPCRFPSPAYARWEPLATKAPFLSREGSAPTRCDSSVLPCMRARCQPSIPARARARSRGRARVQVHVRSTV